LNVTEDCLHIFEEDGGDVFHPKLTYGFALLTTALNSPYYAYILLGLDDNTMFGFAAHYAVRSTSDGILYNYNYDYENYNVISLNYTMDNYFIKERPWFEPYRHSNRTSWVEAFRTLQMPSEVISGVARPYYSLKYKKQVGVLFLGYSLNELGIYLKSIQVSNATRIFILDREEKIIACSRGEAFEYVNGAAVQLDAEHNDDMIIRTTYRLLKERNAFNTTMNGVNIFSYDSEEDGERMIIYTRIKDMTGVDWILIINAVDKELTGSVENANRICAIICSVCLAFVLIISICIGCCLARPLRKIERQMNKVTTVDFIGTETRIRSYGIAEIDDIIESLDRMKVGLNNFHKYVPSTIVRGILKTSDNQLKLVPQDVTILFCDIKDFTCMSDQLTPQGLVQLLCHFFTLMSNVVDKNNGSVDKYIGSAIMVC
jgi:hypothetical protein